MPEEVTDDQLVCHYLLRHNLWNALQTTDNINPYAIACDTFLAHRTGTTVEELRELPVMTVNNLFKWELADYRKEQEAEMKAYKEK